jgi:hypothetical protein
MIPKAAWLISVSFSADGINYSVGAEVKFKK